jgi:hypothetical protein
MSQSYTSRDLPALEGLLQVAPVRYRFLIETLRLNVEVLFVAVDEYQSRFSIATSNNGNFSISLSFRALIVSAKPQNAIVCKLG